MEPIRILTPDQMALIDEAAQTMTVLSPVLRRTNVRAVVLGSMRIARDGRQLARNV